jgi:hypothetical protein
MVTSRPGDLKTLVPLLKGHFGRVVGVDGGLGPRRKAVAAGLEVRPVDVGADQEAVVQANDLAVEERIQPTLPTSW